MRGAWVGRKITAERSPGVSNYKDCAIRWNNIYPDSVKIRQTPLPTGSEAILLAA
jgi:hypothetical protein